MRERSKTTRPKGYSEAPIGFDNLGQAILAGW